MVSTDRPVEPTPEKRSVKQRRLDKRKAARIETHRQRFNQNKTLIEFQPDAVEIEQRSVAGGARWTLYTSILFMCFAIGWSYWAKVDKIVSATGQLVNIEPPVIIQTSLAAPIISMDAKFGDRVETGQLLATLDPTFTASDLQSLRTKLQGFDASIARLNAERTAVPFTLEGRVPNDDLMMQYENYLQRRDEYRAKIREFDSEGRKLAIQTENTAASIEQLTIDHDIYSEMETTTQRLFGKGSASLVEKLSRQIQTRDAAGKLREAKGRAEELVAEIDALDKRRAAFTASWNSKVVSELIEHQQQRKAVEQEINKATKMSEWDEIRVPPNDKYDEFFVFEVADRSLGSVTKEGEPLFKLIPANSPLEVEVEVQGKDIGLIAIGSEVKVKLTSFPYQKHGTLKGTVRAISEGSFEKEGPGGVTSTTYKVIVKLDDSVKLEKLGREIRLMPGMAVIGEVKVGRRRVIQYFLYPLIRYWDTSIREP